MFTQKHLSLRLLASLCAFAALPSLPALAQDTKADPMMTIRSHRYDTSDGVEEAAQIGFSLMSTESTPVKVDFGDGRIQSFTVTANGQIGENEADDTLSGGTLISGTVGPTGVIRVWGDPEKIDYLDVHGSQVYDLDIAQLTNLTIISVSHNELEHLDLSQMTRLQYIDVADNNFAHGFTLGDNHPALQLLNINQLGLGALTSGTVDIAKFPILDQFTAWDTKCLRTLDPTHNPTLRRISVDNSGVTSIDVSGNPNLQVLNVSDCGFTELDVTHNPYLVQLYVANESYSDTDLKLTSLDLTQNKHLECVFLDGNGLTTIDLSGNPDLQVFRGANNRFDHLDISMLHKLIDLDLSGNCFDFCTLPEPSPRCGQNLYYYYDLQQPWQVATEFAVGHTLDLTKRALRPGTETLGFLFTQSIDGISDPVMLQEGTDYTYSEGCITFKTVQTDPVYAHFINSEYQACDMKTTTFMVRSAEDFGKPVTFFSFTPALTSGEPFTYSYTSNGQEITCEGIYDSQRVDVQGTMGSHITRLSMAGVQLADIDLSLLYELERLDLSHCGLTDIDLSWNRRLANLELSHNQLTRLDLTAVNNAYNKNILTTIKASHNRLKEFIATVPVTIETLWLDDNQLTDISLLDMSRLRDLNLDGNLLTDLILRDCESLATARLNDNLFTTFDLSPCTSLLTLDARGNCIRYSTVPEAEDYTQLILAPQRPITIAATAQVVDLMAEAEVRGCVTTYTWRNAQTGQPLTEGVDYTLTKGKTKFLAPVRGQQVYCELTNAAFPDFTGNDVLRTSVTTATDEPQYVVASFTTPVGGQTANLSLAAAEPNTYIYIDWGDGDLQEFALQTTYKIFTGTTVKGGNVRVLSNTLADGGITVFSIGNVTMSQVDVSAMERLYCLTIDNAGLSTIDLSHNPDLHELSLGDNEFSELDLSHNPLLGMLYLSGNHFTTLDATNCKNLYWLQASHNEMQSVNVTGLTDLQALDLTHNQLSEIDVTTCTSLWQLFVAENQLHSIDLSHNHTLNVVNLNDNYFDFSTLPIPEWNVYYYANQAPLSVSCEDGKVDLRSQYRVGSSLSEYYWFVGPIEYYYDEEGNLGLVNQELIEGEDFTVDAGIITFREDWPELTGLVYNAVFPDILLFTEVIPVTASGFDAIEADRHEHAYYSLDGRRLTSKPQGGIYIRDGRKFLVPQCLPFGYP